MSIPRPARLLFDENVGKPMVAELARLQERALEGERAEILHVIDFRAQFELGLWDEVWIPQAAQGGWTVIAGDRGKGGIAKGKKLPQLCIEHGMTHVLIGQAVHHRTYFRKLTTFISVWHELVDIAKAPAGGRFLLEPASSLESHRGRGRLSPRAVAPTPRPPLRPFQPEKEDRQDRSA